MRDNIILSGWLLVVIAIWYYLMRNYLRYEASIEAHEDYLDELEYFRTRDYARPDSNREYEGPFMLDDEPRDVA